MLFFCLELTIYLFTIMSIDLTLEKKIWLQNVLISGIVNLGQKKPGKDLEGPKGPFMWCLLKVFICGWVCKVFSTSHVVETSLITLVKCAVPRAKAWWPTSSHLLSVTLKSDNLFSPGNMVVRLKNLCSLTVDCTQLGRSVSATLSGQFLWAVFWAQSTSSQPDQVCTQWFSNTIQWIQEIRAKKGYYTTHWLVAELPLWQIGDSTFCLWNFCFFQSDLLGTNRSDL